MVDAGLVGRAEEVAYLGGTHALDDLRDVVFGEALLDGDEMAVGRNAGGVAGVTVRQLRIPVHRLAAGPGPLVGRLAHGRFDVALGGLPRDKRVTVNAGAASQGEGEGERDDQSRKLCYGKIALTPFLGLIRPCRARG